MTYKKDDDATLDFAFDWSDWLATSETISSYTITVPTGITLETVAPHAQSESAGVVTFWLSGGTANTWYKVACKIVTNAGRTDERTMDVKVLER